MRSGGIAVDIRSGRRPAARLVVIDDVGGAPVVERVEDFASDDVDLATQLHDMSEALLSRLAGAALDRVVVRRADRPPRAANTEGPRVRLLMEGAMTRAARSIVVHTRIGTGKDTGTWYGDKKSVLDAEAVRLLLLHGFPAAYGEAASAALAGLALA